MVVEVAVVVVVVVVVVKEVVVEQRGARAPLLGSHLMDDLIGGEAPRRPHRHLMLGVHSRDLSLRTDRLHRHE